MGSGSYNEEERETRATALGYYDKKPEEIFSQTAINNEMNPYNITLRESRDSKEHPNSLACILGLDVTGSMGSIPYFLIKNGLPQIMGKIIQKGIKDPQVLFLGIGDHECDAAPLQVGQFESSDELLDKWLSAIYLEGGGGSNDGESYMLAWYFASQHTDIDCLNKRDQKGILFTIGDEPVLKKINRNNLKKIMGHGQFPDYSSIDWLEHAKRKYHVYHLHVMEGAHGQRQDVINGWKQILGENLILIKNKEEIPNKIIEIFVPIAKKNSFKKSVSEPRTQIVETGVTETEQEIIL